MYMDSTSRKQDEERLYEQLMLGIGEFCTSLDWLSEKALASDATDRFQQMWKVYLDLMNKVGAELFGSDVYWNTDSDQIEPVLDMLLNQGYSEKIMQLILGANNLLIQVKTNDYINHASKLQEIARRYYATIRRYEDGGVLTIEDRMVKWDFIDRSNSLFGAAYDIVQDFSRSPKSTEVPQEDQEELEKLQRALENKFDELFEEIDHPIRHKIKRFFRKIFPKRRS